MAHSHAKFGWEVFTDQVIAALNEHREKSSIFYFGEAMRRKKGNLFDRNRHYVLLPRTLLHFLHIVVF